MSLDFPSELPAFHEFIAGQIENSGELRTPEECLEMWRALHPQSDELAESVEAVRTALQDMEAGDKGISARELLNKAVRSAN